MALPTWAMGALLGAGMSKGSGVSVQTSTSQNVNQAANVNVNPIIAVGTPQAHYGPQSNLSDKTDQEAISTSDQSWRQAQPAGVGLPSPAATRYGPYTSQYDEVVDTGDANFLTTVTSMPVMLGIGLITIFSVFAMKRKRGR